MPKSAGSAAMPPPTARPWCWRSADWTSVAVGLLAVCLYANTLGAGFVYDDSRAVLRNPDVTGGAPWPAAFRHDFWGTPLAHSGSHGSYRPLAVLSLRLNALIAGGLLPAAVPVRDLAWLFHLGNVALHAANSLLVLSLCRRLHRPAAAVAALLFAAHPVHCEAVAGVVGRADLLCTLFCLLGLHLFVTHVKQRGRLVCGHGAPAAARSLDPQPSKDLLNRLLDRALHARPLAEAKAARAARPCQRCTIRSSGTLLAALLSAVLATLCKETGATLVGVFFVYELLVQLRCHRSKHQRVELSRLALLVVAGAALVAARLALVGFRAPRFAAADNPAAHDRSRLTRALTFLYLPALNARLLLWPQQLSFDWSMDAVPRVASLADPRNALSAALYLGLWRCALRAWRAVRASQESSSFTTAHARPRRAAGEDTDANNNKTAVRPEGPATAGALGAAEAVLAGLALLVLPLLPASNLFFYVGFVVAERVLYLPSVGFCLLVGIGAVRAQRCLRGRLTRRALATLSALALAALAARTLERNADWHDEVALYRSGIDVNPAKAYGNLGSVLSGMNKTEEAEYAYRMALRHRPNMADVHYNLGNLLALNKNYDAAIASYELAIRFRPTLALAYVNLGHVMALQGRVGAARRVLREGGALSSAGQRDPAAHDAARASALFHLATIEASVGDLAEAERALHDALRVSPPGYDTRPLRKLLAEVRQGSPKGSPKGSPQARPTLPVHEVILPQAVGELGEGPVGPPPAAVRSDCKAANGSRCVATDSRRVVSHS